MQQINSSNATAGKNSRNIAQCNFQQSKSNSLKEMECKMQCARQEGRGRVLQAVNIGSARQENRLARYTRVAAGDVAKYFARHFVR